MNTFHPILMKRLWQRERTRLLLFSLSLFAFWLLIIALYPNFADMQLEQMMEALPSFMQSMFGGGEIGLNELASWIVIGFNHPVVVGIYGVFAVMVGTDAVAGEVTARTADHLFSTPLRRSQIVGTNALFLLFGCLVLSLGVFLGLFLGQLVVDVELAMLQVFYVCLNASLVYAAAGAVSLTVSTWATQAGRAAGISASILTAMFLVHYLADFWSVLASLQPLSIFAYFDPEGILTRNTSILTDAAVLLAASLLLIAIAQWRVNRIDL